MTDLGLMPTSHNKSLYFIVPLLNIKIKEIKELENSYITEKGNVIIATKINSQWLTHPNYLTDFKDTETDTTYTVFSLPEEFINDFINFMAGKYSKFSKTAINHIIAFSGLKYLEGKNKVVSKLILALEKSEILKHYLETELKIILNEDDEYFEIPDRSEYIDININEKYL